VDLIKSGVGACLLPDFDQLGIDCEGHGFGRGFDLHGAALSGNLLGSGAIWHDVRRLFDDVGENNS
jgi:hypothetical protein